MFLQSPGTQEMPNPNSPARNVRSDTAHSVTNARGGVAVADGTGRVSQRGEHGVDNIVEDRLEVDVDRSEEGLKAERGTRVVVKDYKTGEFVTRRIAFMPKILTPATKSEWAFQKIFGDKDYIAAGSELTSTVKLVLSMHGKGWQSDEEAFRHILTEAQDTHGAKTYELDENTVDTFQEGVDALIEAGAKDALGMRDDA
ncbi:hypothetical protein B0H14DRAFT_3427290 [Mycena olivaceomarginata]|nr:hypothetical protein B0H14DRAFT_3427290 [Mycena olivaceomarginata]